MELGDRLGAAGLIMCLIGLGITILWPTKRWIGWISLGLGLLLGLGWGFLEMGAKKRDDSKVEVKKAEPLSIPAPKKPRGAEGTPAATIKNSSLELQQKTLKLVVTIRSVYDEWRGKRIRNQTWTSAELKKTTDPIERENINKENISMNELASGRAVMSYIDCCKRDAIRLRDELIEVGPPGTRSEYMFSLYDISYYPGGNNNPVPIATIADDLERMASMIH
jgi:hypothetical protein